MTNPLYMSKLNYMDERVVFISGKLVEYYLNELDGM